MTMGANSKVIFALSLVHFTGDFYAAFLTPLLPLFVDKLGLTLTQVGLLAGVSRFLAFVVQPSAGYVADHYHTRIFILGGPLLATVFMPLIGVAPSYVVLLFFVSMGSIGVSMFHPPAAGMVSQYAGSRFGLSMALFNLWAVMVLRSFVGQVYMTFLPIYYAREGFSLLSIGTIVSIFTVAGALSGVAAGHFSDRFGFKPIFFLSHGLATPCLYLLLLLHRDWAYASAFLAGFFVMASLPLGVTMAQEIAPKGKSMVSSLMMGLAWGTGGMMTPLAGKLADLFSIRPVLAALAVIPLLSVGLIAMLPERAPKKMSKQ